MNWFAALALMLTALLPEARAGSHHRFEAVEPHMGTLVRVTVYARDEREAADAFRTAFDRIAALDRILSDYRTDSELNAVTRTAVGRPVPVSGDLFAVLRASQTLAEATDGAFDITQGPVIRLWREARKTGRIPDAAALEEAGQRSGFRKLHLDAARKTVTCDVAGMALDVGAIGKGYAASEAIAALTSRGIDRALVAVSGDLAFSGAPPGRPGWRIRIHSEEESATGISSILELTHAAVSTSGSSEQHIDIGGRRYSHVIDPAARMGLIGDVSVTVIAPHGLDADGLDTAISVLGPERGLALIESRPRTAALILERKGGAVAVRASTGLRLFATDSVRRRAEGEKK